MKVLEGLQSYWEERSVTYSQQNLEEMNSWKRDAWRDLILEHAPKKKTLRILDIGTGPGFFAINLALAGHQVTAVDVTNEMLNCAKENAKAYGANVKFVLHNGDSLPFDKESFDLVISRNVLWNLEYPVQAMQEWKRVLAIDGQMVYFDANWYLHLFDKKQKERREEAHRQLQEKFPEEQLNQLGEEKVLFLEELAKKLPLSRESRPAWDEKIIKQIGMEIISIDETVGKRVWTEIDKIHYTATPLFLMCAQKKGEKRH